MCTILALQSIEVVDNNLVNFSEGNDATPTKIDKNNWWGGGSARL